MIYRGCLITRDEPGMSWTVLRPTTQAERELPLEERPDLTVGWADTRAEAKSLIDHYLEVHRD